MKLHLRSQGPCRWHQAGATWARGTAYTPDGAALDAPALAAYLDATPDTFADHIASLGGTFAAVQTGLTVRTATDRVRSIPLFYGHNGAELCLSDDARWLAETVGARLDSPVAAAELLLASITTGASTLCSAVRQVQAAEIVTFAAEGGAPSSARYFFYGDGDRLDADETALVAEGVRLFEEAFERFLATVAGRTLVVPLSGGLDSRLMAAMLVRGGRTDALCFCYGRERSAEAQASRGVAEALGLRWTFIPYSNADWHRWFASPGFQQFRRHATGLAAIEHEQDWPAVLALKTRGLADDAVFLPGHSGDFLSNGHLLPTPTDTDPAQLILDRHYVRWPWDGVQPDLREALRARIRDVIADLPPALPHLAFEWQERQAKMLVNSVRVYEHHGFDWRLPLWESPAVLDFWGRAPLPLLRSRSLYRRVLRELMGDALYGLPSPRRIPSRLVGKLYRLTDRDLGRYGIWLGPRPLLAGLRTRLDDLHAIEHPAIRPVVDQFIKPLSALPPQRVTIDGLLALSQLDMLSRELG